METRRHVAILFAAGLASFERSGDPSERDFAEAARLGADRAAQGISIGGLLGAVQAGRTRALEIAVQRARAADIPDGLLLEVLLDMDRYLGALERHVISGHRAAERDLAGDRADAGDRVLRGLLLGEEPEPSPSGARPGGPAPGRPLPLPGRRGRRPRAAAPGGPLGWRPRAESAVRSAAAWPRSRTGCRMGCETDLLVVADPAAPLSELPSMYGLCLAALPLAARSPRRGPHLLMDHAVDLALTAQPLLAGLNSAAFLGELRAADDFHRELASTALAYLDHGQRLDHTATALHVHPNTVRYRLRRLHELTGVPIVAGEPGDHRSVPELLRLWWALRTWLESLSRRSEGIRGLQCLTMHCGRS
nr:hypothetical protein GCM10020092_063030 [Actinoplanes digitatis]